MIPEDEDPADIFKSHVLNLTGLIKLMLGGKVTPRRRRFVGQGDFETYASRDITPDKKDFSNLAVPLLEDLQTVLANMENGQGLAQRLEKYTRGTYAGFVNRPTNIDIKNRLIVFSVRDLEEELRPIAMYIVLNFVWTLVKAQLKKEF